MMHQSANVSGILNGSGVMLEAGAPANLSHQSAMGVGDGGDVSPSKRAGGKFPKDVFQFRSVKRRVL